jgi:hypothetical protein
MTDNKNKQGVPPAGPAVGDEDPDYSPMRDDDAGRQRDTDASKKLKEQVKRDIERPQKGSA